MATIKEYTTKKGNLFKIVGYLGTDRLTGKQVNIKKGGFATKQDAKRYLSQAVINLQDNKYLDTSIHVSKTYQEVYEEWLVQYKNTVKESTFFKTQSMFKNNILPIFSNLRINSITTTFIQDNANKWFEKYKNYKKIINYNFSVLAYALRMGYISINHKDRFVMPKKIRVRKDESMSYYTKDELIELLKYIKQDTSIEWLSFFRLLAFTGMRKGECLALTWNDIDLTNQTVTVNKTLSVGMNSKQIVQPPKTLESYRTITLDDNTVSWLKKWKIDQAKTLLKFGHNAMRENQLVYCQCSKNKMYCLGKPATILKKVCNKHNFKIINIHGFRHTHASLLFESGAAMEVVRDRLGHTDIQTTVNIYTHVTQKSRDKTAQNFANYMGI